MSPLRLHAVVGSAIVLAAVAFATESSPARPTAEPAKFVSKRYGYSIVLDGAWKAKYARTGWTGNFPLMDSGQVDVFTDSTGQRFFIVAATPVRPGTTLRRWVGSHAQVMSGFALCKKPRAYRSTRLGGGSAREFLESCYDHDAIVVAAVHRGRGYTFQFVSPRENSLASDRSIFEPGRRSFRFTP